MSIFDLAKLDKCIGGSLDIFFLFIPFLNRGSRQNPCF